MVDLDGLHLVGAVAVLVGLRLILSWEGVSPGTVGLAPKLIIPAILAVVGFFTVFNAIAASLAVASGQPETIGYHWTVSPTEAVVWFSVLFVVAGVVEEVAFRGYLQTKLIALLGGQGMARIGLGIFLASLLFAAYHIPRIIAGGTPNEMTPLVYLATLTLSAIGYGILYEWTHNLYIPILMHTAGNAPGTWGILFVTTANWPPWAFAGYLLAYFGVILVVLLVYRRWAYNVGLMPVWTERSKLGQQ